MYVYIFLSKKCNIYIYKNLRLSKLNKLIIIYYSYYILIFFLINIFNYLISDFYKYKYYISLIKKYIHTPNTFIFHCKKLTMFW